MYKTEVIYTQICSEGLCKWHVSRIKGNFFFFQSLYSRIGTYLLIFQTFYFHFVTYLEFPAEKESTTDLWMQKPLGMTVPLC